MLFQPNTYAVLLVSSAEKFHNSLRAMLPPATYYPVHTAEDAGAARRAMQERAYDIVIVNAPLRDEPGKQLAVDVVSDRAAVCLLLVRTEFYEDACEQLVPQGVFLLPKPLTQSTFLHAVQWLSAARERLRRTEKQTATLEEKMEEIRLVNHAKWVLIDCDGLTEEAAHHQIERLAMDQCVSRRVIAEQILKRHKE